MLAPFRLLAAGVLMKLQWEETQDRTKLTMLRTVYGMHAPMRLLMERKIVKPVRRLVFGL